MPELMARRLSVSLAIVVIFAATPAVAAGPQANFAAHASFDLPDDSADSKAARNSPERSLLHNILLDQERLWTSPSRLRVKDLRWLLPLAGASAGLFAADTQIEHNLPDDPGVVNDSRHASSAGVAALGGTVVGLYLWGRMKHDDHRREVGLLGAEALADSFLVTEVLKLGTQRERPPQGDRDGSFWHGGSSFPSEHSGAAWAVAAVLATEYPRPAVKVLAYGLAGGVAAMRVTGRRHFSSDVFVGSAVGWYVGHYVSRAHHSDKADHGEFGSFRRTAR